MTPATEPEARERRSALLQGVKRLADAFDPEPGHSAQVTALALTLFDRLAGLHGFQGRPRLLLEIAAVLHDIGWSRTKNNGHHKHSRDMILEAELPGLTSRERNLCALIARYHNKAMPDKKRHRTFAELPKQDRGLVAWLAAILRVADGLDCLHNGAARIAECTVGKKRLTISLAKPGRCAAEMQRARQKSDLLERMAKRKVIFC